jgi:hypothetical protein
MRRAFLVVWYACQACLGLAVIGVAAVSQLAGSERFEPGESTSSPDARSTTREPIRSEARLPSQGPFLP